MKDFVERLRAKPEQTRKTIALSSAAAVTAVVAIGWLIALFSSGSLSLAPASDTAFDPSGTIQEGERRFNTLAGAAGAFYQDPSGEASVTVIEEDRSSTLDRTETEPTEETVIHF